MEGLLLTEAGCCGSKAASRICKRPSLLTIRQFDITFIIPWKYTSLHTVLRTHCTFCQMYLIENSQFIAEQRVGFRFPSSQWCCSRGQWGGRGPLWLPAGRRIILPHSSCTKTAPRPNFKSMEIELLDLAHIEERQKMRKRACPSLMSGRTGHLR